MLDFPKLDPDQEDEVRNAYGQESSTAWCGAETSELWERALHDYFGPYNLFISSRSEQLRHYRSGYIAGKGWRSRDAQGDTHKADRLEDESAAVRMTRDQFEAEKSLNALKIYSFQRLVFDGMEPLLKLADEAHTMTRGKLARKIKSLVEDARKTLNDPELRQDLRPSGELEAALALLRRCRSADLGDELASAVDALLSRYGA